MQRARWFPDSQLLTSAENLLRRQRTRAPSSLPPEEDTEPDLSWAEPWRSGGPTETSVAAQPGAGSGRMWSPPHLPNLSANRGCHMLATTSLSAIWISHPSHFG